MASRRYELSDGQWAKIAALLPGKAGGPGRTGSDNRLFINGCPRFYARARIGAICLSVTANGRRCSARSSYSDHVKNCYLQGASADELWLSMKSL